MNSTWTWYFGTGQNSNGDPHFKGFITHEFGHATGGWLVGHWYQTSNADPSLCDTTNYMQYHTMCSGISDDKSWRWPTLEKHDEHTFQNAYP
jgi:hypothetical protein